MAFPTQSHFFHAVVQQVPFSWRQKGKTRNQSLTLTSLKFSLPKFTACFCFSFMNPASDHWYFKAWVSLITWAMLQFIYLPGNSRNQILKGIMTGITLLQKKYQGFVLHCGWIAVCSKSVCIKLHQGKICELFGSLKNITPTMVSKNEEETNKIKNMPRNETTLLLFIQSHTNAFPGSGR